jgi:hypothetical protein
MNPEDEEGLEPESWPYSAFAYLVSADTLLIVQTIDLPFRILLGLSSRPKT